jgi:hypothetical protein
METAFSGRTMTIQQRLATAFLALLIVGSVALMPSEADSKPQKSAAAHATQMAPSENATSEPVRDLTYN